MNELATSDCDMRVGGMSSKGDDFNAVARLIPARQWVIFPFDAPTRAARLRSFRLLVETGRGHVVLIEFRLRNVTNADIYKIIDTLTTDPAPYKPHSKSYSHLDDLGVKPVLLDEAVNKVESFCTHTIIGEIFLDDFLARSLRGEPISTDNRADFEKRLKEDLRSQVDNFIGNLSKDIVQTIDEIGCVCKPTIYNYLVGESEKESLNLLQAARVFPVIVPHLASGNGLLEVHDAIRNQRPLLKAVTSGFQIQKSVARAVQGFGLVAIGAEWADKPHVLFKLLTTLPCDLRPKDAETWAAFNTAVQVILQSSGMPILCTRNRLWLYACAARKFNVENIGAELERAASDIDEFVSALVAVLNFELRRNNLHHAGHSMSAVEVFLASQNDILKFANIARRYEAAYLRESADFANAEERVLLSGARWQSVLEVPFVTPLRTIHHLITAEALLDEGDDMQHCVGGYAVHCFSGVAVIFSIRDREGRRCSTMHVTISKDNNGAIKINIVQHKGRRNAEPSRECRMAVFSLLRHLNQDKKNILSFLAWRKDIAGLGKDARALQIMMRPMTAAMRKVLPSAWPLDRLMALTQESAKKCQS